jgi:hypothetical protein
MAMQPVKVPPSAGAEPRANNGHRLHDVASNDVASSFDDGVGEKAQPASKWQKAKQHFRRRWWIYLIALVIFLAIFLPIL